MIARIATFVPMTADIEIEARRNLLERFQPALQRQPDLVAAYWLDGRGQVMEVHLLVGKCRSHGTWGSASQCHTFATGAGCLENPVSQQSRDL